MNEESRIKSFSTPVSVMDKSFQFSKSAERKMMSEYTRNRFGLAKRHPETATRSGNRNGNEKRQKAVKGERAINGES